MDILAKLKKIATHFNHSVTAVQRLSKIQEELGVPQHSIIQAVQTRWNSTLHMLVRMIDQKRAITAYSSDHGHFSCLSAEEWSIASNLAETLGPLEEVTLEFSRADSSTFCILPCTEVLHRLLESEGPTTRGIQTMRKAMLNSLQKRFSKVMGSKEVVLSCVLDPRYKERPLVPEMLTKVKTWLKEAMETSPPDSATETPPEESDPKRRTEDQVPSLLLLLRSTSETVEPEGIIEELERYFREPVIDRKSGNPYDWWKHNTNQFHQTVSFSKAVPLLSTLLCGERKSVQHHREYL